MSTLKKISNFSDTVNLFGDIFEGNETQLSIDHVEKTVLSAYHIQGREIKFIIPRTFGRYMVLNKLRFWFKLKYAVEKDYIKIYINPSFAFEKVEVALNSQNVLSMYNQYHGRTHQIMKFLKYERDHRLYCSSERIYNYDDNSEKARMKFHDSKPIGTHYVDFCYSIDTSLFDLNKILLDNIEMEITFYVPSNLAARCFYIDQGEGGVTENQVEFVKAFLTADFVVPRDNLREYLIKGLERSPVPYDTYLIHSYRYPDQPVGNNNIENCYINNRWPSYFIMCVIPKADENWDINVDTKWSNHSLVSNLQLNVKGINVPNRMIPVEDTTDFIGASLYYKYLKDAFPNNSFDFMKLINKMIYVYDLENSEYYDPEENVDVNIQYTNIHTQNLNVYIIFLTKHQILIDNDRNVKVI